MSTHTEPAPAGANDINEIFRGGGRSVEFLDSINKASIVMLAERGLVPHATARAIARGIAELVTQHREAGRRHSADYLDYEPKLTAIVGADASRLHTGRSRQDIASTIARMNLRDGLLQEIQALVTACEKLVARSGITIEHWGERPFAARRQEMFEVYNDAWSDNWGFVPFTKGEFFKIVDDMRLIMRSELFLFVYVERELAAFFGAVPNLFEVLTTRGAARGWELARAVRMLLKKSSIRGFRLGYLGVKKRFRRLGLDAVALWHQHRTARRLGYEYCDLGWVLETNRLVMRMADRFGAVPSKRYALFEKQL